MINHKVIIELRSETSGLIIAFILKGMIPITQYCSISLSEVTYHFKSRPDK